ncbi:Propeptide PepSY amd peptidase M4 [Xylanimonas cellulosilytica DSM 15894]|uniref:Propeptide PepSY amd peptidase M4 n=1 Tax=Xylanimonas cellulosilytica (strain DSM 15894 / JCM 12276 / CECT 5975 / KCTC 9989 / LMG 20990 / NBRC 107835 / XIL07) TaxID=446471 RepID=D1BXW2_XYLCX|nr:PepSY domain-containing protein [Xylanimonas cellulosilytica]ACZ31753.1 Propeptide PepSY amd peptidase M4 [Xylanimonas cellulosilytica DSM 15894]
MNARMTKRTRTLTAVSAGIVASVLVLTACGSAGSEADAPATETPVAEAPATEAPAEDAITLQVAKAVAVAAVGEGEVTYYGDEDDHGARWEIEVTRADGAEVDVYVDAEGRVVHTTERPAEEPAQAAPAPEASAPAPEAPAAEAPAPAPSGTVTLAEAKRIAVAHVGGGRVTYHGLEDDHGARWEIEVTRPGGSEVDVYVAADGRVVRTVG